MPVAVELTITLTVGMTMILKLNKCVAFVLVNKQNA